jgi:Fic family protein
LDWFEFSIGYHFSCPVEYLDFHSCSSIEEQMDNLITWYGTEAQQFHPIKRAAMLHNLFVKIHPFIDGNGRTARLLMNLELLKTGFVPIVIKKQQRLLYYQALDRSHVVGDFEDFIQMLVELEQERLDFYLRFLYLGYTTSHYFVDVFLFNRCIYLTSCVTGCFFVLASYM